MSSPDIFAAKPTNAGVRRPNKLPIVIVSCVGILAACAFGYTLFQRAANQNASADADPQTKLTPSSADDILRDVTANGLIEAEAPPAPPAPVTYTDANGESRTVTVGQDGSVSVTPATTPGNQNTAGPTNRLHEREWQLYDQQMTSLRTERFSTARTALSASTEARDFDTRVGESVQAQGAAPSTTGSSIGDSLLAAAQAQAAQLNGGGTSAASGALGDMTETSTLDTQYAKNKEAWLSNEPDPAQYLPSGRRAQAALWEIKTGTVIPSVMIGGINSDLPGTIIGQVRENVWDTATGTLLLIPQGAKLVGRYDNAITRGQSRVLVAWTRIIYPDGSTVDLGAMAGTDQAGYAGFKDKVNNHYFRVFGDALLMSAFSAGVQLSQPNDNTAELTSADIATAQLGQQLGQAGIAITQRNLNIQPTLIIRPGYRFNIMVTKDMILRPWEG